jgi:predicted Rossmann-fold nucleotide-binding protein
LKESLVENGTISENDLELFRIIDDPEDVLSYIKKTVIV